MKSYFADFHVHVGYSKSEKWVKIPTSKLLTVENILEHATMTKGMDIIGIVDAMSPYVMDDLSALVAEGSLTSLTGGGYCYKDKLTIYLGAEIETKEKKGGVAHSLFFLPDIDTMQKFASFMSRYIKNINLSTQNAHLPLNQLVSIAHDFEAAVIPAHVFTPHKSLYGACSNRLVDILSDRNMGHVTAIELGLSADSNMADRIAELTNFSFLTNSDAHSLEKIAREYNILRMENSGLNEFILACRNKNHRSIHANYGLDPKLGKYHRSLCETCNNLLVSNDTLYCCPNCRSPKITKGVYDRIQEIADWDEPRHPKYRPQYHYQTPLEFIPGLGKKTMKKLLDAFGTEMKVIHEVRKEQLVAVVGEKIAEDIINARLGKLKINAGGGGRYGTVVNSSS